MEREEDHSAVIARSDGWCRRQLRRYLRDPTMSDIGYTAHIVRHTGPRDFTRDLVRFEPRPCTRCGAWPENPNWLTCYACQLACTEKPAKARGKEKRKGRARAITI